jgi:hypothetical protein
VITVVFCLPQNQILPSPSQIPHPISKFDGQLLLSVPQLSITLSLPGLIAISPSSVDKERVNLIQWNGMEGILFSFLALLLSCLLALLLACLLVDSHDSWAFVVFVMQGEKQTVDLIVWVGCKVDDRRVPKADEALRLKTIDDARRLRKSVAPLI